MSKRKNISAPINAKSNVRVLTSEHSDHLRTHNGGAMEKWDRTMLSDEVKFEVVIAKE